MSCDATTVLVEAAQDGIAKEPAEANLVRAALLAQSVQTLSPATSVTANDVLTRAAANGYTKSLGPKILRIITAQNLCDAIDAV